VLAIWRVVLQPVGKHPRTVHLPEPEEAVMSRSVTMTIAEGSLSGKGFTLEDRGRYVIGRADDCDIQLSGGPYLLGVSRHHCVLALEPGSLRVRDLGSRNGTFVNGENIGQRLGPDPGDDNLDDFMDFELSDGDELSIGCFTFQVHVQEGSAVHDAFVNYPVKLH
jgi:pSer/pThr/pTyr-binding forkhead associated (FHA) protein